VHGARNNPRSYYNQLIHTDLDAISVVSNLLRFFLMAAMSTREISKRLLPKSLLLLAMKILR
jgi:hypothetical protein